MPTPQYTVAGEIAQLFAQGLYPIGHARERMKALGLDDESIELLLESAVNSNSTLTPAAQKHYEDLRRACRELQLAWRAAEKEHILEDCFNLTHYLEAPITKINHLIGEQKE